MGGPGTLGFKKAGITFRKVVELGENITFGRPLSNPVSYPMNRNTYMCSYSLSRGPHIP